MVLASLLAATLMLADSGHMTLIAHGWCASHGEMVHGLEHDAEHGVEHERSRSGSLPQLDGHGGDDGHEHCDALATHEVAVLAAPVLAASLLPRGLADQAKRGRAAVSGGRLYLLAPKTSPPAA